ncbi:MAG: GTPase [Candidatus Competibacteraceae bacterium]|jgi:small GTP-binding protein|nr:GTPase [Candidatus Competibacteraceae bacterium]
MNIDKKWLLLIIITALPLFLLMLAGLVALWRNDWLLAWLGLSGIVALCSWLILNRLKKDQPAPEILQVEPPSTWSKQGLQAWKKVEDLAETIRVREGVFNDWNSLWDIFREVVDSVANDFHPEQSDPILEIRMPELLKVIELLARDLRYSLSDNIPGSHILTINDVLRGKRLAAHGKTLYQLYRIISVGVDPISAAIRELRGLAAEKVWDASIKEVEQWLVAAYVKKIGYYAIELYSGHLVLEDQQFLEHITQASRHDLVELNKQATRVQEEPLRILVIGQVKAGKSSLINALFGETKALVDVVPLTSRVQPYLLERDGIKNAIILDTAGYEDSNNPRRPWREAEQEILQTDLIILVCSALTAARAADRRMLEELQILFSNEYQENPPPIIIVLTHVDQLRPFREWNPPYNVQQPDNLKARRIRDAMVAVAEDLDVAPEQIIPVCLKVSHEYNINAGLIPAILQTLNVSQRLKYLRCLRDYKNEEYWHQLWDQSKNAGRILVKLGAQWLQKGMPH